jgi:NADPH:quinone reductase-like Zn-dependent oxidoreductase
MRAAVLHATGEPIQLEEVRLAEPRAGELLVRVQAACVCHIQAEQAAKLAAGLDAELGTAPWHQACDVGSPGRWPVIWGPTASG